MKRSQLILKTLLVFSLIMTMFSCNQDIEENVPKLRTEETDGDIIAKAIETMQSAPDDNKERIESFGITYEDFSAKAILETNVRRYYDSRRTVHTYYSPETGRGHRVGNYEGIAFRTAGVTNGSSLSGSTYRLAILFLNPSKTDFVISTSGTEDTNLINRGWTTAGPISNFVYLYRNGGNGRRPLYRFYKASISDHLFTKNYSEGINNGFRFEGVVGYVK